MTFGDIGVLLPNGGGAEHYKAVLAMPDVIAPKGFKGWTPSKFGKIKSFERTLPEDSHLAGQDLFGQEVTINEGNFEFKCMVVNQQELLSTFFLSSSIVRRTNC